MWFVATRNFAVARALQETPAAGFEQITTPLDAEAIRLVTRHQASEVNRLFFHGWGLVQIPIAIIALGLAWRVQEGRMLVLLAGLMLVIVTGLELYVVPETIRLGRVLDFIPRDPPPPEDAPFWRLHHAYTGLDMLKFVLGIASAVILAARGASF